MTDGVQGDAVKRDVPLSFSPYRREYGYRYWREEVGKYVVQQPDPFQTEHDPMKELR